MRRTTVVLILSSILVLNLAHSRGGAEQRPPQLKTPLEVANTLDKVLQARFHKDSGKFGITRIGLPGHTNVLGLHAEAEEDKPLLKALQEAKYPYAIGFFRCAHKPGTRFISEQEQNIRPEPRENINHYWTVGIVQNQKYFSNGEDGVPEREAKQWAQHYEPAIQKACVKSLASLKLGKPISILQKPFLIAMRPVRAIEKKCLGCHKQAKRGDTLGVLVYTIRDIRK